jgi:23S rRNA-intervening sequence protein
MGHSYKDLVVWQKSIAMVTEIYRATQSFPREETYGLTSQLRRSAVSVASNIAEGQGRLSKKGISAVSRPRERIDGGNGDSGLDRPQSGVSLRSGYGSTDENLGSSQPPSSWADAIAPTRRDQKLETRNRKRRCSPVLN